MLSGCLVWTTACLLPLDDSIAPIVSVGGVDAVTTAMMLHVGSAKVHAQEAALALLTDVNSQ